MPALPDPDRLHPITLPDGTPHRGTVHLATAQDHPNLDVGDWTYCSAHSVPGDWAAHLAPYLYPGAPERVRIGKFCQIASGVRIITAAANHAMGGITTYPFPAFSPETMLDYHPDRRDTVIGHDVWIGTDALICPGAVIGSGVIIGAGSVVRGTVPDYAIVTGNPAQVVRMRFAAEDVARLMALAWWDWPRDRIEGAQEALQAGDIAALEAMAP